MTFTLNDINLQMTLTFKQTLEVCSWILWIMKFHSFDLDLDPVTLLLKLDLDIVKVYWKWSSLF